MGIRGDPALHFFLAGLPPQFRCCFPHIQKETSITVGPDESIIYYCKSRVCDLSYFRYFPGFGDSHPGLRVFLEFALKKHWR